MLQNRILIIDDEPDAVFILRFALEKAGYTVTAVAGAAEALPIVQRQEADLVLLDLVLSEGSGLDICRALREAESTRTLPIILVTGKLRNEFDTVEGFKAGADDYVMKPFRPAEVVARVEGLLDRTRRLRDASPVTGLPGPLGIAREFHRLLRDRAPWGVIGADLQGFRLYNEMYGFARGDEVLRAVGACLTQAAQQVEDSNFVGHAGSDNFVITTTPQQMDTLAEHAINRFNSCLGALYPPEIIEAGCIKRQNRRGEEVKAPLLALALAGVTNELRTFSNPLEITAIAADLKVVLHARPGSAYVKDRRTGRVEN